MCVWLKKAQSDLNVLRLDDYIMDIRGLLLDPHGTADVSFTVENQVVHAHSAVLYARCPLLFEKVCAFFFCHVC